MNVQYDFCGWATRNDIKCADGRVIKKNAFIDNDGSVVPLIWNHRHDSPEYVLGHALLENRSDGMYAYCKFNNGGMANEARECVDNGDVTSMSIWANKLKQNGGDVIHGVIREVSLVYAGANPGAYITDVIAHSDDEEYEAEICFNQPICLQHSATDNPVPEDSKSEEKTKEKDDKKMADSKEKTIQDVFDELTDEQKDVVYFLIGEAVNNASGDNSNDDEEGDDEMKHNIFEGSDYEDDNYLSHADMEEIISDAKRYGSLKDSVLAHGITDIEYLFPEDHNLNNPPEWIKRDTGWVSKVMGAVHHTPFSRIKSQFADITADDARAKGYIKGNLKKEQVFSLLKRSTPPTTIYKKQKLDRDDVIDITDFDVVAWIKGEMRIMLDEELARAFLIGDGRLASSDDKINDQCIRPIVGDAALYTILKTVTVKPTDSENVQAKKIIRGIVKSRIDYKGSGTPTMYCGENLLTMLLLMEDRNGRIIYETVDKLASALRVKEIVTVPFFDTTPETIKDRDGNVVSAIIVNLSDYNVGADKGGAVNMFDDFDIDYNAQKYLIETRCSGALVKPYSAIAVSVTAESTEPGDGGDDSADDSDDDAVDGNS